MGLKVAMRSALDLDPLELMGRIVLTVMNGLRIVLVKNIALPFIGKLWFGTHVQNIAIQHVHHGVHQHVIAKKHSRYIDNSIYLLFCIHGIIIIGAELCERSKMCKLWIYN